MSVCAGTKRDGSTCTATVDPPQEYCWWHDPANAEERRRAASKAGKSRPNRELAGVKALCEDLTDRVLAGSLLPGPAAVANQLINTRLRAIEQARKNRETEDLEARIEAIEAKMPKLQPTQGGNRWQQR
ncbi:MAG: Mcm10/DnaG-type zinc finger protein [Actinomycetota bacterium]|nr:Mcm10/DnaG-type zinc finger protein [Actinomycetota bacterium]